MIPSPQHPLSPHISYQVIHLASGEPMQVSEPIGLTAKFAPSASPSQSPAIPGSRLSAGDALLDYVAFPVDSSNSSSSTSAPTLRISPLEQQVPYPHHHSSSSSTTSSSTPRFTLCVAAGELLFAPCLDEIGPPLQWYSDTLILHLVEQLAEGFPELDSHSLPSYWQDANLLHAVLRASTDAHCSSPHALWLFRDFVNALGQDGITPLLQVIRSFEGDLALAQQHIAYLVQLGADVDGADRRGITPVDVCAESHPEIFQQLVAAGAKGGKRTIMLLKLYTRLRRQMAAADATSPGVSRGVSATDESTTPADVSPSPAALSRSNSHNTIPPPEGFFRALRTLVDRNRQLSWAVALEAVLPASPDPEESYASLLVQGQTVGERRLPAWAFYRLFPKGGTEPTAHNMRGRRPVSLLWRPDTRLAVKARPELPGLEAAVSELSRMTFGDWIAPYWEMLRVGSEAVPMLMSLGVQGDSLQQVLESAAPDQQLQLLEAASTSAALLNAMLVCLEDGHPDQYLLEPRPDGLLQLVCVDNERGLCSVPQSSTASSAVSSATSSLAGSVRGRRGIDSVLPKSVLFCLDQMLWKVEPSVRAKILSLDPAHIIQRWLAKCELIHQQHLALYTPAEAQQLLQHPTQPTVLGVPLDSTNIGRVLFNRLRRMQAVLSRSPNATHLDVLHVVEPVLAARYAAVLSDPLPVRQRFDAVDGKYFAAAAVVGPTDKTATMRSIISSTSSTNTNDVSPTVCADTIPALHTIIPLDVFIKSFNISELSTLPVLCLPGLDHCPQKAREISASLIKQTVRSEDMAKQHQALQQQPEILTMLQAEAEQERLLASMDWSLAAEECQNNVLRQLANRHLRQLTLRSFAALVDNDLVNRLRLESLTDLHVSNCLQLRLTTKAAAALAISAPFLQRLTLSLLPAVTAFEPKVPARTASFPCLQQFVLTQCDEVERVCFRAPVLNSLDVSNCPRLTLLQVEAPLLSHVSVFSFRKRGTLDCALIRFLSSSSLPVDVL